MPWLGKNRKTHLRSCRSRGITWLNDKTGLIASLFLALTITGTINGAISHTEYKPGASSPITVSAIPQNVQEFDELQAQIGGEPQGAAALCIIAMEMYQKYGFAVASPCLQKCNTEINMHSYMMNRLKDFFGPNSTLDRPYQMAAFFKDASPENGYNPSRPLTIEVFVSKIDGYQKSNSLKGNVIYLRVKFSGSDSMKDVGVEVVLPSGEQYYRVSSCPGLYSTVKAAAAGQSFNGM